MQNLVSENVQKPIKTGSSLNEGIIAEQLIIFTLSSFFVFLYLPIYIFQKDSQNYAFDSITLCHVYEITESIKIDVSL